MSGAETAMTDEIIGAMLALLDERQAARSRHAAAVLREHRFTVSSVDELRHRLDALRTN